METLFIMAILIILYTDHPLLHTIVDHPLGKLILLLIVIAVTHFYGRNIGIITAMVLILLFHRMFEGMDNMNDKETTSKNDEKINKSDDDDDSDSDDDDSDDDSDDVKNIKSSVEHESINNKSNQNVIDQIDNEKKIKSVAQNPEIAGSKDDNKEGFVGIGGSLLGTSKCSLGGSIFN